ncbi:MAG: hypothetical protein M3N91_11915 [Pseudomonadota bacterium]|nr:hypothetical protein [Pseudomonadota bacterium]
MQIQSDLQTAAQPTLLSRLTRAAAQLETASKFALLGIFFGWFLVDTLVVTIGSLQHGVRFVDMSAVIADPTRLFFGIQGSSHRIFFSVICILCLLAPVLPHLRRKRANWLAYLAPLALMVICGALLYSRTSSELFAAPSGVSSAGNSLIRFANDLVRQGTGLVARHVSVGVGGYLALVASLVLALRGVRHFRNAPA